MCCHNIYLLLLLIKFCAMIKANHTLKEKAIKSVTPGHLNVKVVAIKKSKTQLKKNHLKASRLSMTWY